MIKRLGHTAKVGALITVAATSLLVAGATPALADTSTATANAATLELLGNPLITTGTCDVTHISNQSLPAEVCNENPSLSGGVLAAGLLSQTAVANPGSPPSGSPATSAACAGVVASNGTIQIGPAGDCQFTAGSPDGVVIDLGAVARITADAIIAECTATSVPQGGTVAVSFVNAEVQLLVAGIPVGLPIPIDSNPAPDTPVLGLGALLTIMLNDVPDVPVPGQVSTTALHVTVLGLPDPLIDLSLGNVTCGPNAVAADIPVIPFEGLPIALAMVTAAGVVALVVHRRRRIRTADAA